jgi:hypothetical protein
MRRCLAIPVALVQDAAAHYSRIDYEHQRRRCDGDMVGKQSKHQKASIKMAELP